MLTLKSKKVRHKVPRQDNVLRAIFFVILSKFPYHPWSKARFPFRHLWGPTISTASESHWACVVPSFRPLTWATPRRLIASQKFELIEQAPPFPCCTMANLPGRCCNLVE